MNSRKRARSTSTGSLHEPRATRKTHKTQRRQAVATKPSTAGTTRQRQAGQLNCGDSASDSDSEAEPEAVKIEEVSCLTYSETCYQTGAPFFEPVVPIPGAPVAIDHDEERIYILTFHNNSGEGPGSTLHCLDIKSKTWDNSVQNLTFNNQFSSNTKFMPSCRGTRMSVVKIGDEKYIFVIGGHFGCPERPERWSSFNKHLTILYIKLSTKVWGVLDTVGVAPWRYDHAVANVDNTLYIFGGRRTLPNHPEDYDVNWQYPAEDILQSFSVLRFDQEGGRWVWTTENCPPHIGVIGFALDALPMNYGANEVQILLTPGLKGGRPEHNFNTDSQFLLFHPKRHTFLSWKHDPRTPRSPCSLGNYQSDTFCNRAVFSVFSSDLVKYSMTSIKFYSHRPPFEDSLRVLGSVSVSKLKKSYPEFRKPKAFVAFMVVNGRPYSLARDEDVHQVDTIIEVKFN